MMMAVGERATARGDGCGPERCEGAQRVRRMPLCTYQAAASVHAHTSILMDDYPQTSSHCHLSSLVEEEEREDGA